MTLGIEVRKAVEADIEQVYQIYEEFDNVQVESLPPEFRNIRKRKPDAEKLIKSAIEDHINDANKTFYVAEQDGEIAGYILDQYRK